MSTIDPSRVAKFRTFLRSGGSVDLRSWLGMEAGDVEALAEAGVQIMVERAGLVAEELAARLIRPAPVTDPLEAAARKAIQTGGAGG